MGKYKYKVVNAAGGSCVVLPGSKFYLKYKKGTHVKAPKGSLGIMLFGNRRDAVAFLSVSGDPHSAKRLIKRVTPIGKPVFPKEVVWAICNSNLEKFNRYKAGGPELVLQGRPPEGTVCYPEVIVVD